MSNWYEGKWSHFMANLKDRFEQFIKTLNGFESIDHLLLRERNPQSRADYFLKQRGFILEQKSIEKPPGFNLQDFVDKVVKENNPAPCRTFKPFTKEMLYTNTSYRLAEQQFTKRLRKSLHNANKQIKYTKEIFGAAQANGIVILLNENITDLSPELIAIAVTKTLEKKQNDELEYGHIDAVIAISETHIVNNNEIKNAYPLQNITKSDGENLADLREFGSDFLAAWSKFNNWGHLKVESIKSVFPTDRIK